MNIERVVMDELLVTSGGVDGLRREVETALAGLAPSPPRRGGAAGMRNEGPSRETGMGSRIAAAILAAAVGHGVGRADR